MVALYKCYEHFILGLYNIYMPGKQQQDSKRIVVMRLSVKGIPEIVVLQQGKLSGYTDDLTKWFNTQQTAKTMTKSRQQKQAALKMVQAAQQKLKRQLMQASQGTISGQRRQQRPPSLISIA